MHPPYAASTLHMQPVCVCVYMHIYIYIYVCITILYILLVYIYMYIYICIYMYIYMYICICIFLLPALQGNPCSLQGGGSPKVWQTSAISRGRDTEREREILVSHYSSELLVLHKCCRTLSSFIGFSNLPTHWPLPMCCKSLCHSQGPGMNSICCMAYLDMLHTAYHLAVCL